MPEMMTERARWLARVGVKRAWTFDERNEVLALLRVYHDPEEKAEVGAPYDAVPE